MTGFGLGGSRLAAGRLLVEIRSLNHRYLEVRVRIPVELQEQAFFVEQLCREHLTRGRHEVNIRLDGFSRESVRLDHDKAKAAFVSLLALRDELAPGQELPLPLLASVPDLFQAAPPFETTALQAALTEACVDSIGKLKEMRAREGAALSRELKARVELARAAIEEMRTLAPSLVRSAHTRLEERVRRLVSDGNLQLDTGRLELEVALIADRADVTEELARLQSHFDQFETLTQKDEAVGRALDFLLQEMSREANTIGAKAQDTQLSHRVVQLKSEIERLREQVQNVE